MTEQVIGQIGQNVTAKQTGNTLVLEIDLEQTIGLSSSGKMMGIASTGGFVPVPVFNLDLLRGKAIKLNLYLGEK